MFPRPGREHYGSFVAEPALELSRRGHHVEVISPVPMVPSGLGWLSPGWRELTRLPLEREVDSIRVRHPRYLHFPRRFLFAGSSARMARSILKLDGLTGWDLIHAHAAMPDGGAARRVAAALGIPWVLTSHGSDVLRATTWSPTVHAETHDAMRAADLVLAPSSIHLERARERGLPCEKGRVLWNGFDPGSFSPEQPEAPHLSKEPAASASPRTDPPEQTATTGSQPIRLICVANLVPSKRIEILLGALTIIKSRGHDYLLRLIGDGPERSALESKAAALDLDVTFAGSLPRHSMAAELRQADIFVLPARGESFGIVYLEAMATGLPVVAPAGEGIADIIEHGRQGLLVSGDLPADLADAVLELITNPERRFQMGHAAAETAGQLGWDRHVTELEKLYDGILTGQTESPGKTVLHLLYNSEPDRNGYAMRSRYILANQLALGLGIQATTSPFQLATWSGGPRESQGGILYHRLRLRGVDRRRGRLGWRRYLVFLVKFLADLFLARQVTSIIRTEKPAVLHAHSPAFNLFLARRAASRVASRTPGGKQDRLPLIYEVRGLTEETETLVGNTSSHSPLYRFKRTLEERAMKQADMVVTLSQGMRRDFIQRGIPGEKIRVVPNGVDSRAIIPPERDPEMAASLGLTAGKTLGYIGSMGRLEGLPWLVEQLSALPPEWRLVLVGDGQDRPAILQRAEQLGLTERLIAPGSLPHDQVALWYGLIDYIVLPRPSFRVTELVTPLKPLEAMAAGRIVLASDIGGHREIMVNGENGFLFSREKPMEFRQLISDLAEDQPHRHKLGKSARSWVTENRDWRRLVAHYNEIYNQAGGSR
jgi:glycosyltransferase involved in cell wall biosynthesis